MRKNHICKKLPTEALTELGKGADKLFSFQDYAILCHILDNNEPNWTAAFNWGQDPAGGQAA